MFIQGHLEYQGTLHSHKHIKDCAQALMPNACIGAFATRVLLALSDCVPVQHRHTGGRHASPGAELPAALRLCKDAARL